MCKRTTHSRKAVMAIDFPFTTMHRNLLKDLGSDTWVELIAREILRRRSEGQTPTVEDIATHFEQNKPAFMEGESDATHRRGLREVTKKVVKGLRVNNSRAEIQKLAKAIG